MSREIIFLYLLKSFWYVIAAFCSLFDELEVCELLEARKLVERKNGVFGEDKHSVEKKKVKFTAARNKRLHAPGTDGNITCNFPRFIQLNLNYLALLILKVL